MALSLLLSLLPLFSCLSIDDAPTSFPALILGLPEGVQLPCGAGVHLRLTPTANRTQELGPAAVTAWLDTLDQCNIELYTAGDGDASGGSEWSLVDRSTSGYRWDTTTFSVERDLWQLPNGDASTIFATITLPDFCPMYSGSGVVRSVAALTRHVFGVRCDGALIARSSHFFPNVAIGLITPAAFATHYVTPFRELEVSMVVADPLEGEIQLDGVKEEYGLQYVVVSFELYSKDEDHPSRVAGRSPATDNTGVKDPLYLVHEFTSSQPDAYLNQWNSYNDEAMIDPPIIIEARIPLSVDAFPDGEYYLRPTFSDSHFYTPIIIVSPSSDAPYVQCDAGTIGAVLSARAYGVDLVSYGEYRTSFETIPYCFHMTKDGSLMSKMSFLVIASFAAAETHVAVYGSPALVSSFYSDGDDRHSAHILVIAFRGTADSADWDTNFDATSASCDEWDIPCTVADDDDDGPGQIHRGFVREYRAVRSIVDTAVRPLIAENVEVTVILTGHSQGGAIATIAALDLANRAPSNMKVNVVTMGSPRVGFGDFHTMYGRIVGHDRHLRIEAKRDAVTVVPPFFDHVGTLVDVPCSSWLLLNECHYTAQYVAGASRVDRPAEWVSLVDSVNQWDEDKAGLRVAAPAGSNEAASTTLSTSTIAIIVAAAVVGCACSVSLVAAATILVLRRSRSTKATKHKPVNRSRSASTARHRRGAASRSSSQSRMHAPQLM